MISLRRHIDESQSEQLLLAELKVSYTDALQSIATSFLPVQEALATENRREVRGMLQSLSESLEVQRLVFIRDRLNKLLHTYAETGTEIIELRQVEIKRILRVFAEAFAALSNQNEANDGRLISFTRKLESIISIDDLPEVRKRLSSEVSELKHATVEMRRDRSASVNDLKRELHLFQARLAQTEQLAETDALTQLKNRRGGERIADAYIRDSRGFSILLFDLNGFKGINDRWGHQAGDSMLMQYAARLRSAVRGDDTVCRWGGDEFLVLLGGCSLARARERGKQLARATETEYDLKVLDGKVRVRLRASCGAAEYQPGESIDTLFRRADEALYEAKGVAVAALSESV